MVKPKRWEYSSVLMIGRKFRFTHNDSITWDIEIINETLTHFYVRNINTGRRWNEPKRGFYDKYSEIS
jgi:hypothetical protein